MTEDPKRFSSLQARAALLGVVLTASRNDLERWTYIATLGAITQELETLDAVEGWIEAVVTATATEG